MSTQMQRIAPRELTEEERASFDANGWVRVDRLISEEDAGALLARLKEKMGEEGLDEQHPLGPNSSARWRVYAPLSVELRSGAVRDPLYHSLSHSPELGRVAEGLLGTRGRYWVDQALVKPPAGNDGSGETGWHRDILDQQRSPFEPSGQVNIWIALAEVTLAHGAMRFVPAGRLSDEVRELTKGRPVEESLRDLERRGLVSEPLHLRPGDATAHAGATLHCAPPNRTATPRWAYFVSVFPADSTYTGNEVWPMAGVEGVEAGRPFPDHRFAVL